MWAMCLHVCKRASYQTNHQVRDTVCMALANDERRVKHSTMLSRVTLFELLLSGFVR